MRTWLIALVLGCGTAVASACVGPDGIEYSALEAAVRSGDLQEVRRLLDDGADPNQETDGSTPMRAAVGRSDPEMVELLLSRDGDAGWVSRAGWSLLELAATRKLPDDGSDDADDARIIQLLAGARADPCRASTYTETEGKLASDIASRDGRGGPLIDLLLDLESEC